MSLVPHTVGLVVDRNFGQRVAPFARSFHVWIVESPANTPFIQKFWENEQQALDRDPLSFGITSFGARDSESPEEICTRLAGIVDEHHDDSSHDPPWSELQIFGVKLTPTLQEAFQEIGATTFEATEEGFICRRTPAGH